MNEPYQMIDVFGGRQWDRTTKKRLLNRKALENFGYKVYSQNDEDGIIQEIFRRIGTTNQKFIEFGVQNGLESNGHFLLFKSWTGLWIEGNADYCKEIREKFAPIITKKQLQLIHAFITKDNINQLIFEEGHICGEVDLLSIDIDGNDYYIWDSINVINPRVVIIEYNGKFPPDVEWKMAYNSKHIWDGSDWQGASLKALELLGRKKGYTLVGTNYRGVNAFFVRNNLVKHKFYGSGISEKLYNPFRLNIQYFSGHPCKYCISTQIEELGPFNYIDKNKLCPHSGFYDFEVSTWGSFSWMSSQKSEILFYADPKLKNIIITYYYIGSETTEMEEFESQQVQFTSEKLSPSQITLSVGIEEKIILSTTVKETGLKTLEIPITNEVDRNRVSILTLTCSSLWVPAIRLGNGDFRKLGVGIVWEKCKESFL